jgi:formylglycine-generating enzyme required for sulfatase activity
MAHKSDVPPQTDSDPKKLIPEDETKRKAQTRDNTAPIALGPPPKLSDIGDGGQVFRECVNCPAMVVIPPGKVLIGSASNQSGHDSSEEPRREVQFKQAFAVGRDAVSYAEWDACVVEGGCNNFFPGDMGWGRGQQPVVLVSWDDAKAYTKWLSDKTGASYRLLSEAEWEYAARGCRSSSCQDQIFWFGNKINPDRANYDWRYSYAGSQKAHLLGKPLPTGTNGPNPFGLFNSIGNVAQWVDDCWTDNLKFASADGSPHEVNGCAAHVFRGGSWHDEPVDLRSAARKSDLAASRQPYIGFRVARTLTE